MHGWQYCIQAISKAAKCSRLKRADVTRKSAGVSAWCAPRRRGRRRRWHLGSEVAGARLGAMSEDS
eukprot:6193221-Pleurochrysis_carterae.AAC.1